MNDRSPRRLAFGLGLALSIAACSSATEEPVNEGPVIDSVDAPDSIKEESGRYTLPMTITFHDPEKDAVTKIRYRISPGGLDQTETIQGPTANASALQVAITLVNPAKQTYSYTINLIDARGAEGAPFQKDVTVE